VSIGKLLREKREERKLSVADVSAGIKVNKKYIQALEDENFPLIPSQVYAKGFLKAYAHFLGLDAKSLVDELAAFYKNREEGNKAAVSAPKITRMISVPKMPNLPKMPDMPKLKFDKNTMYIALLSFFVLIFLLSIYGYVLSHQRRAVLIKANPPATGKIIPAKVPAKEGKIEVKIETIGRSWLSVTSGTKELYSETLEPGMKLRFVGKEIKVKAGNGGAVKIYKDGNFLGLMGQEGVVSERTYRASE
jgi:transcriptional regulator with XRE-family HTH domain